MSAPQLRICIVYDRVYPASIGGAERWYRLLAERLASEGHQVTYLTTRHWPDPEFPYIPGVCIVCCAIQQDIYARGRRRLAPVIQFGWAVGWHLLRHGRNYDVVQTSAMSSWTALACSTLARVRGFRVVLDWWEVWTGRYWREYAGPAPGFAGWLMQQIVAHSPHQPIAHSELHARRLQRNGPRRSIAIHRGLLADAQVVEAPAPPDPLVVYVGRQIPEKLVPAIVPALALARRTLPELRAVLFGDGPDAAFIRQAVVGAGLTSVIDLPGFVDEETLVETLSRALCLVLLSRREGFGLVVAEAAARGVPSVVLRHEDSAAAELIVDGVNGVLCTSTDPQEVASAILRVHDAGQSMRRSTLNWFRAQASELTIDGTLPHLLAIYRNDEIEGNSAG